MNQSSIQMNTGKQLPMAEKAVLTIMRVMMTDYGSQYKAICKDKQSATTYKNRLIKKLGNFELQDIFDGYENATEESPKFMPAIPDLFAHVKALDNKRKRIDTQKIEAERMSALPPPTHNVDPIKLLNQAKTDHKPTDEECRLERLAAGRQNHQSVLALHGANITKRYTGKEHGCAMGGCFKAGSISSGAGYVCAEHYRLA